MRLVDSPIPWAIVGFAIGFALGVNSISVILLTIGLGVYLLYLWRHGPAKAGSEGRLFAAGPVFIVAWVVGFIAHSLVL